MRARVVLPVKPVGRRRFETAPGVPKRHNHEPTPERLMQIAWGYAPPLILEAALHHRVFDLHSSRGHLHLRGDQQVAA